MGEKFETVSLAKTGPIACKSDHRPAALPKARRPKRPVPS